jgi:hypothetical protein
VRSARLAVGRRKGKGHKNANFGLKNNNNEALRFDATVGGFSSDGLGLSSCVIEI